MKIKELKELISQYDDDFRVELVSDEYSYKWYKIVGIADVSYSDKKIVLDGREV